MKVTRTLALASCLASASLLTLSACGPEDHRPDPSALYSGDAGLQSKDLIEMTDHLAADLLKIPQIAQNPEKITIVVTGIDNNTSEPGVDLGIFVKRLAVKIATNASDRVTFVEKRDVIQRLQQQEGANFQDPFGDTSRGFTPNAAPNRLLPQYVLHGDFSELRKRNSSFFLCEFNLAKLGGPTNGEFVWKRAYETKTLNY